MYQHSSEIEEEKKEKDSINELFHRSLQFKNSDDFMRFISFVAKVDHYSHFNAMLVYIQNPNVEYFGSSGYWKNNFNRTINKNARPYIAMLPFGPVMIVYDLYDTTGKETPDELLKKSIGNGIFKVTGNIIPDIFIEKLTYILSLYNIHVYYEKFNVTQGGKTNDYNKNSATIILNKSFKNEELFGTLIHELAHIFLGHLSNKELKLKNIDNEDKNIILKGKLQKSIKIKETTSPRKIFDIEAELVSFMVCQRLGLETNSYKYLSLYISDETIKEIDIKTVLKVADRIEGCFISHIL